jgi:toxin YoeB
MKITFEPKGWEDYQYWQMHDQKMLIKINSLILDARRSPFRGIGKPEPLKGDLKGWWSRRIDDEHRLVYRLIGTGNDQRIEVAQCRWHY